MVERGTQLARGTSSNLNDTEICKLAGSMFIIKYYLLGYILRRMNVLVMPVQPGPATVRGSKKTKETTWLFGTSFLSILSIKCGNWFYWADRAETGERAEAKNSLFSCVFEAMSLRIRDLQK
jgi:hypothetical protein